MYVLCADGRVQASDRESDQWEQCALAAGFYSPTTPPLAPFFAPLLLSLSALPCCCFLTSTWIAWLRLGSDDQQTDTHNEAGLQGISTQHDVVFPPRCQHDPFHQEIAGVFFSASASSTLYRSDPTMDLQLVPSAFGCTGDFVAKYSVLQSSGFDCPAEWGRVLHFWHGAGESDCVICQCACAVRCDSHALDANILYNPYFIMRFSSFSNGDTITQMCRKFVDLSDREVPLQSGCQMYDFICATMKKHPGMLVTSIAMLYHAWSTNMAISFIVNNHDHSNLRLMAGKPPRAGIGLPESVSMRAGNGMPFSASINDVIAASQPCEDGQYQAYLYCVGLKKMPHTNCDVRVMVDSGSASMAVSHPNNVAQGYDCLILQHPGCVPIFPVCRAVVRLL